MPRLQEEDLKKMLNAEHRARRAVELRCERYRAALVVYLDRARKVRSSASYGYLSAVSDLWADLRANGIDPSELEG